jgi:hypothetical protein
MSNINPMPLILGLRDARLSPDRFDMGHWCFNREVKTAYSYIGEINKARHDCGTVMCLAGWASAYVPQGYAEGEIHRTVADDVIAGIYEGKGDEGNRKSEHTLRRLFQQHEASLEEVEIGVYFFVRRYAPDYLPDLLAFLPAFCLLPQSARWAKTLAEIFGDHTTQDEIN